MKPEKISREIIDLLETKTMDIPLDDYIEVLEEVLSGVQMKLEAAEGDKAMQDQ